MIRCRWGWQRWQLNHAKQINNHKGHSGIYTGTNSKDDISHKEQAVTITSYRRLPPSTKGSLRIHHFPEMKTTLLSSEGALLLLPQETVPWDPSTISFCLPLHVLYFQQSSCMLYHLLDCKTLYYKTRFSILREVWKVYSQGRDRILLWISSLIYCVPSKLALIFGSHSWFGTIFATWSFWCTTPAFSTPSGKVSICMLESSSKSFYV